jgi:hypothetical protein
MSIIIVKIVVVVKAVVGKVVSIVAVGVVVISVNVDVVVVVIEVYRVNHDQTSSISSNFTVVVREVMLVPKLSKAL